MKSRLCFFCSVLLILVAIVLFINAGKWLTPPEFSLLPSDVIVVLGGGDADGRARQGADLYNHGWSANILLTASSKPVSTNKSPVTSIRVSHLVKAGVPIQAIKYEYRSRSSYDEAINTLAMMQLNGWQRAIVVSDPPHQRRLQLTWGRVFRNTGHSYFLVASKPAWWDAASWWRNKKSAKFVLSEYVKLFWYFLRYR